MHDYSDRMDVLSHGTREIIFDSPLRYAWFEVKGMIRFFIDPGRFDLVSFMGQHTKGGKGFLYYLNAQGLRGALRFLFSGGGGMSLLLVFILLANLIKTGGLLLFSLNSRVDPHIKIFLLLLILYIAFATGPLGASRFAMPLIPLVIFMALAQGNFTLNRGGGELTNTPKIIMVSENVKARPA